MATTESVIANIQARATREELQKVSEHIGACMTRREDQALEAVHKQLRRLRREVATSSWHAAFAETLITALDAYFGNIEMTLRLEQLAREVNAAPLWREIVLVLRDHGEINQEAIRAAITERNAGLAASKPTISVALEDLRVRELVEHVPGEDRRERIHSLTRRGQSVCQKLGPAVRPASVTPSAAVPVRQKTTGPHASLSGPIVAAAADAPSGRARRASDPVPGRKS